MREIKFRVWDKVTKKMIYDANSDIKIYLNGSISQHGSWVDPEIIALQFTGLHDKNGKEIYEGDITRIVYPEGGKDGIGIIKFFEGAFRSIPLEYNEWTWEKLKKTFYADRFEIFEEENVAGNIYENPELVSHPNV